MKTVTYGEHKTLLSSLRRYHAYIANNDGSIVNRYFGMHKIELCSVNLERKTYYFVMMKNAFKTKSCLKHKFDIKGSTRGRLTVVDDKSA
jgi:1-phosphatidylinositol-4-phosphate 5-kinase